MTQLIIFCAKYLFVASPAIVLWVLFKSNGANRRLLILRGIVVLLVGFVLAQVGGKLYIEPRPFIVQHVAPLIPHNAENGFPSDHALVTFGLAFLLLPFDGIAGVLAIAVAIAVSIGRVESLLHTPLDIVASAIMAAVANGVAYRVFRPKIDSDKEVSQL